MEQTVALVGRVPRPALNGYHCVWGVKSYLYMEYYGTAMMAGTNLSIKFNARQQRFSEPEVVGL